MQSKPEERIAPPINWDLAWEHSSYLKSPLNTAPIRELNKLKISTQMAKQSKVTIPASYWLSKPAFALMKKQMIRPLSQGDCNMLAPFIYFSVFEDSRIAGGSIEVKHLPLYKTGESFPSAVVIESDLLSNITETTQEEDFSQTQTMSNFGKYSAKTVFKFKKLGIHEKVLPQILSAMGFKLPDGTRFEFPKPYSSVKVNRFYHSSLPDSLDLETDSIHHDFPYNQHLDEARLGISIVHMQAGPNFQESYGRGFFLAGMSTKPNDIESNVYVLPANNRYAVIMLMDHCLHGTERWSEEAEEGSYRTSYNFRFVISSPRHPLDLWSKIIEGSWKPL